MIMYTYNRLLVRKCQMPLIPPGHDLKQKTPLRLRSGEMSIMISAELPAL